MWKTVAVAVTALAIAGGSMVYAKQRGAAGDMHRGQISDQDRSAYTDARLAALKAGLKLTPEQEKNWPALEKALRDRAQARADRVVAGKADRPSDPIERLRQRAERMTERGASLKQVADAAAPLYQSLDDAQKHRFRVLARLDRRLSAGGEHWGHHRHGGMHRMMPDHMMQGDDHAAPGTGDAQPKSQ
jgi:hypothetical protein